MESLEKRYTELYGKAPAPAYKSREGWLEGKIAEKEPKLEGKELNTIIIDEAKEHVDPPKTANQEKAEAKKKRMTEFSLKTDGRQYWAENSKLGIVSPKSSKQTAELFIKRNA